VTTDRVNVREGPGTAYGLVGQVVQGQQLDIVGKNPAGDWWQVCCVDGRQAWIVDRLVQAQGDLAVVQVVSDIAPPPPTATPRPTATSAPTATPPPSYSFKSEGVVSVRTSTNPLIQVWGQIYDRTRKIAVENRVVRVTRGGVTVAEATSTYAVGAEGGWSWAYGGLPNRFIYNVKIEIPFVEGSYEAYIVSGDKPTSEPVQFTVTGEDRVFVLAWQEK
jgi:hypothetical protein